MRSSTVRVAVAWLGFATAACSGGSSAHGTPTATMSRSFTTSPGQIVFVNDPLAAGQHQQLYVERADGSGVRRLLTSTFDDVAPTISPDGARVVFTRVDNPRPDRIFMVGVDGSGLHQIVPSGCPSVCGDAVEGHAWSPDGRQLVFTRAIYGDGSGSPTEVELWISNADGTEARRVTRETRRAQDDFGGWSPDGSTLVFMHWVYGSPDHFEIATIRVDGGRMHRITPIGLDAADPGWSPDGGLIVFQSPPDPEAGVAQNIYTVHPDGSHLTLLTPHLGGVATNHASWSPDGTQLLFSHAPSGPLGGDLFVMSRDGTGLHVLAVSSLNENAAFWGPSPPG